MAKLKFGASSKRDRANPTVGIIGFGHSAEATDHFFSHAYETVIADPQKMKNRSEWSDAKRRVNSCDLGVVCVPTPAREDGSCDLDLVEQTIGWLETPNILLKSAVPVGTTDRLIKESGKQIVVSFDLMNQPPMSLYSGPLDSPHYIFGGEAGGTRRMIEFYLPIAGPAKAYRQTTARNAELTQYMSHAFWATKLAFCYEMAAICDALDIDYYELRELWLMDRRVNPMYTAVYEENHQPFSGNTLSKDMQSLLQFSAGAGYRAEFLEEVLKSNHRIGELRAKAQLKKKRRMEGAKTKRTPKGTPRQLEIDSLLI